MKTRVLLIGLEEDREAIKRFEQQFIPEEHHLTTFVLFRTSDLGDVQEALPKAHSVILLTSQATIRPDSMLGSIKDSTNRRNIRCLIIRVSPTIVAVS